MALRNGATGYIEITIRSLFKLLRSVQMKKFLAMLAVVAVVAFAAPAFAANPFSDVPAGHWAYDAVEQLAARGIVSGMPGSTFKGAQPSTRYEMASIVARSLAVVDMEKASKQDVELLKKLTMEFKDELDALGVKVEGLDKRVAVLEDRLGGWKLTGNFVFEAVFGGDKQGFMNNAAYEAGAETQFRKEAFALFLEKQIDENTSFFAEFMGGADDTGADKTGGMGDMVEGLIWREMYVDTLLPCDVNFRFGRFNVDFEEEYELFNDDEPLFGHFYVDGFRAEKSFGDIRMTGIIGRNSWSDGPGYNSEEEDEVGLDGSYTHMDYIANIHYQPSESFYAGLLGYYRHGDDDRNTDNNYGLKTYGAYASYEVVDDVKLKGVYYYQDIDSEIAKIGANIRANTKNDDAQAWKVVLDVDQDVLKYTSLWLEYNQQDNNFIGIHNERFGIGGSGADYCVGNNKPINDETSKYFFARAEQQWTEKWSTCLRYATVDFDTVGYDDAREYSASVIYQYTPAIAFELMYVNTDFGGDDSANIVWPEQDGPLTGKDDVILFRASIDL